MGCGSSSLKDSEDVGTNAPKPAVPNNNTLQPAEGTALKKVRTNFTNIDYDAPAETHKGSLLKARAPDELDEGPSRNASYAGPTAGTGTGADNLQGESKDAIVEKELAAQKEAAAEKNPLEPSHAKNDESEPEAKPTSDEQQHAKSTLRRSSLMGLLTGQEWRRKNSNFTDADLKKCAGISRDELAERAGIPPAPTPVPRYLTN